MNRNSLAFTQVNRTVPIPEIKLRKMCRRTSLRKFQIGPVGRSVVSDLGELFNPTLTDAGITTMTPTEDP